MAESRKASPNSVKKAQARNLIIVIIMVILLFFILYYFLEKDNRTPNHIQAKEVRFTSPMDNDAINSAWLEQFQSKVSNQERETDSLKEQIALIEKERKEAEKTKNTNTDYQNLVSKLATIENELNQLKTHPAATNAISDVNRMEADHFPVIPNEVGTNFVSENTAGSLAVSGDGDDYLHLTPRRREGRLIPSKNPKNYVPTGTHVLGVLLMGADLVAADYDQENPKPILIRLIENGTLPNHRESHLKGCLITGAITGDISSSRGNVRIERLSCVKPDGGIVDVQVDGVVSTNAKEGITGQLYTREGGRVAGATVAGTMAGVANGVSQGYVNYQNSIFGPTGTINSGDLAKYGALQGASSGLNKLSDFEINRAEKIHPVIEVNGGKLVTVVFTKQGFFIDGRENSQNEGYDSTSPVSESKPSSKFPDSAQMVDALLDKN